MFGGAPLNRRREPLRVLLVKPYQPVANYAVAPPLGLLYLASGLRILLADRVDIRFVDAKLAKRDARSLTEDLRWADVVGISALNYEAEASFRLAKLAKALDPAKLTVLGGPFAHGRAVEILGRCPQIDWVFDGEADRAFPEAIRRFLDHLPTDSIPGLYKRDQTGGAVPPPGNDFIQDIDSLPFPAWDLVDFAAYAKAPNMNVWLKGTRYATLFTSRGCPYKCGYCHDIFTKKFRWRSPENVLAEIELLAEHYGIDEFQIVDDIFNLHKPRLKAIFAQLEARYGPSRFHFCFPNGLRGDILDHDVIRTLRRGGAYQITVAIETASPRIQGLIGKNLDIEKVRRVIDFCKAEGILVKGFFMLGFPTETLAELRSTIRFALRSNLTFASFFTVIPQPGTPMHALALAENPAALSVVEAADYHAPRGYYEVATGYPLALVSLWTIIRFYCLSPRRSLRVLRHMGLRQTLAGFRRLGEIGGRYAARLLRRLARRESTAPPMPPATGFGPEARPAKAA